jgi:ArsR family transcriptional regulator
MPSSPRPDPVVLVAKALADPTRYRILCRIAGRREVSCQELTGLFRLAQATVSHHLRILTEAGLVSARPEGPFHFYRAHPEALAAHGRALARAFPRTARPGAPHRR